jgi:hypothetical protein
LLHGLQHIWTPRIEQTRRWAAIFEISMLYRDVRLLNTRLQYEWPVLGGSACSVLEPIAVVREVHLSRWKEQPKRAAFTYGRRGGLPGFSIDELLQAEVASVRYKWEVCNSLQENQGFIAMEWRAVIEDELAEREATKKAMAAAASMTG